MTEEQGTIICDRCNGTGREQNYRQGIEYTERGNIAVNCKCYIDQKCRYPEFFVKCEIIKSTFYYCRKCKGKIYLTWLDQIFGVDDSEFLKRLGD